MRVHLDRFFNIPPARLPAADRRKERREEIDPIQPRLLGLMNLQQQTNDAGQMVYSYLEAGGDSKALLRALSESLLREDAEFHSFQMLEAAVRQYHELDDSGEMALVMVGAARYLAAHSPTQRAMQQTLRVALRLHRGDPVYEAETDTNAAASGPEAAL